MWLVHDAKSDLAAAAVLLGQLSPDACELGVGRTTLADDLTVPSSVIVEVEDAELGARVQAALNEAIILCKVGRVKSAAEDIVDEKLPADRQTEGVKLVVLDKVVHLAKSVGTLNDVVRFAGARQGAGPISSTAKVEAGNVDT